jgi:hypothetical protein
MTGQKWECHSNLRFRLERRNRPLRNALSSRLSLPPKEHCQPSLATRVRLLQYSEPFTYAVHTISNIASSRALLNSVPPTLLLIPAAAIVVQHSHAAVIFTRLPGTSRHRSQEHRIDSLASRWRIRLAPSSTHRSPRLTWLVRRRRGNRPRRRG